MIVLRPAEQGIAAAGGDECVVARARDQQVCAAAAHEDIVAGAADEGVVAISASQPVALQAAPDNVARRDGGGNADWVVRVNAVIARCAAEDVAVGAADEDIVACACGEPVAPCSTIENVVTALGGSDGVVPTTASDVVVACAAVEAVATGGIGLGGVEDPVVEVVLLDVGVGDGVNDGVAVGVLMRGSRLLPNDAPLPCRVYVCSRCQRDGEFRILHIADDVTCGGRHDGRLGILRGGGIAEGEAHVIPRIGPPAFDEHRAVHQQVAACDAVARDEGVEVAYTIGIGATEDFVVAVLFAARKDDGAGGVVAQITFLVAVEYSVDALSCSCVEDVGVHADAAQ